MDKIIQQTVEPLGLSIAATAELTGESTWQVKEKIRTGRYKAKKSGTRTIVIYQSVKADFAGLPDWSTNTKVKTDRARAAALVALTRKREARKV